MAQQSPNSPNPLDQSILAIIQRWYTDNPESRTISRGVRKEISIAVREERQRQFQDYQRTRGDIESTVREHQHNMLVGYRPRVAETPDSWFARQQHLERERLAIEQRITTETRLSAEDRGQAVTALSVAHHAPSVPTLPVFTPQAPTGLHALRARLQARLAQVRAGLVPDKVRRSLAAWEQLHNERQEQAQRLTGRDAAARALDTAQSLGLNDHGVWVSRDTYNQQINRIADLESTVQHLRADNDMIARAAQDWAARLHDETRPVSTPAEPAPQSEPAQDPRPDTDPGSDESSAPPNTVAGAGKPLSEPAGVNDATQTGSAAIDMPQDSESATVGSESVVGQGERVDTTTANLINAAHPNVSAPQPKQATVPTTTDGSQYASAAPSVSDGLDI